MNDTTALMKSPIRNVLWLTVNAMAEKSGLPKIAAMSGVIRSLTTAVTTAPNAPPMITATARSRTFPRNTNCLKPLSIARLLRTQCIGRHGPLRRSVGLVGREERRDLTVLGKIMGEAARDLNGFGQIALPHLHLPERERGFHAHEE